MTELTPIRRGRCAGAGNWQTQYQALQMTAREAAEQDGMDLIDLDELPQLFNVFRGEMSLVGPRPEIPFYVERFRETVPLYMVKYQVRPGMTGWAQIHGLRGDTSIPARVEHDLWYIENWSLGLDIRILFKTAFGGMVNQEDVGSVTNSRTEGGEGMAP